MFDMTAGVAAEIADRLAGDLPADLTAGLHAGMVAGAAESRLHADDITWLADELMHSRSTIGVGISKPTCSAGDSNSTNAAGAGR